METQYLDAPATHRRPQLDLVVGHTQAARASPDQGNPQALPNGSRVSEFRIEGLIGQGGFGIVYRAYDTSLHRAVALKEYMPSALAIRSTDGRHAEPRSAANIPLFEAGLKSFVNEARLLACFDHPALVKVFQFWEANGTAYMAMPMYEGPTLRTVLQARGPGAPEAEIRRWLLPLLDAIDTLHQAHCYHRDIAPDNILITPGGPLLLDFGAARQVIGDMTRALTVVLKPGYAPIEQYGEDPSIGQGPWTDLYALACVVRYAITGHTPISSVERILSDRMRPLGEFAGDDYSAEFLHAIDAALAVRPDDRPQSVGAFRALLAGASGAVDIEIFFDEADDVCDLPLPEPTPLSEVLWEAGDVVDAAPAAATWRLPPGWRKSRRSVWAACGAIVFLGASALVGGLMREPGTAKAATASPVLAAPSPASSFAPSPAPVSAAASAVAVTSEPAHAMRSVDDSITVLPPPAVATLPKLSPQPSDERSMPANEARKKPVVASATLIQPVRATQPAPAEARSATATTATNTGATTTTATTTPPAREDERCTDLLLKASLGTELSEDRVWRRQHCE